MIAGIRGAFHTERDGPASVLSARVPTSAAPPRIADPAWAAEEEQDADVVTDIEDKEKWKAAGSNGNRSGIAGRGQAGQQDVILWRYL